MKVVKPDFVKYHKYLEKVIKQMMGEEVFKNEYNYNINKTFEEIGFDSLDVVELIMNVEKDLNISINDDIAETLDTPAKAINYLIKNEINLKTKMGKFRINS